MNTIHLSTSELRTLQTALYTAGDAGGIVIDLDQPLGEFLHDRLREYHEMIQPRGAHGGRSWAGELLRRIEEEL